jgi:Protein of unknown function (DUF2865)
MLRIVRLPGLLGALTVAASMLASGPAFANVCRSIEAELATMRRGPSAQERQTAARAAAEARSLHGHMQAIGCDRQQFLFFGQAAPAECGGYRARLVQLNAYARQASGSNEGRRRQLMSMLVSHNCRTSPDAPEPRSLPLTAGLFDDGSRKRGELSTDDLDTPRIESRIRNTGGKAVCVRMCDGYFFPLHVRNASLREDGDALCQSLCPATKTKIFFKPGDIEEARSVEGEIYADLDNAYRYRKSYDASCFCRRPGETWSEGRASVLNPEEGGGGAGFDVMNREPFEEADAPLRGMTPVPGRKQDTRLFGNRPPPPPPAPPQPPPEISADKLVTGDQGEVREMRGRDGVTRSVRVIAPELSRGPSGAATPSAQGRAPAP